MKYIVDRESLEEFLSEYGIEAFVDVREDGRARIITDEVEWLITEPYV